MRLFIIAVVALCASACTQPQERAANGCAREATHEVTWTNENAPDVIHVRAEGASCAQAIVVFTARNARGDPLWTFASTYYDLTAGGVPPEGAPPVSPEDVDRFLVSWADVTEMRSDGLPEWREGLSRPGEGVEPFGYESPFERETYEALRQRRLPMICYAFAVAAVKCLVIDPASHAPTEIVAYGS